MVHLLIKLNSEEIDGVPVTGTYAKLIFTEMHLTKIVTFNIDLTYFSPFSFSSSSRYEYSLHESKSYLIKHYMLMNRPDC